MNIQLNDGTYATSVTVDEYMALRNAGLVGFPVRQSDSVGQLAGNDAAPRDMSMASIPCTSFDEQADALRADIERARQARRRTEAEGIHADNAGALKKPILG